MTLTMEAERLAPELRASRVEADELRRMPDATWKALQEAGLFRALQPARWGGGEVHLREFYDAVVEVSRASASAGWVLGVIGVHPWQLALFPEQAQEEVWGADPARMHSSSYAPTGRAERVPGGYRLSGRWSFSSGADHCTAVNVGVIVGKRDMGGGLELPDFRSMVALDGQYAIDDTWHTSGMRGTGSKDIVIADQFIPEHRTQSHLDYLFDRPLPGWETNPGALYRAPQNVVFNYALSAAVFGAALGYLDGWLAESTDRTMQFGGRVADDALMQRRVAELVYDIDAGITKMRRDSDVMMDAGAAGELLPRDERVEMRWNANRSCELIARGVNELHHAASGRSIFADHPLQRGYQDVQGAIGHAFLAPDIVGRGLGAQRLGGTPVAVMA